MKLLRGETLIFTSSRVPSPRPKSVPYLVMLEPLHKGARQVVEFVTQVSDTEQHFSLVRIGKQTKDWRKHKEQ